MKVLLAGDICSRNRTISIIEEKLFEDALREIPSLTSQCDYSLVNLECPVIKDNPTPISKQGPRLYGSTKMMDAVKYMGFDGVTLANNHFYDQGEKGVRETIEALDANHVDHVGGGTNLNEASRILYKEFEDGRLAIINCCEHEFSIATESTGGANPLNPIVQYYAVQEAKKNANYVLVIVHGGHEHYQLPSPRMVETYRFFIDAGADAVVNHHQHCYSGYEQYKDKPIFYGLGNFFFDQGKSEDGTPWNYGYCVQLDFTGNGVSYKLYPYEQCKKEPNIRLLDVNAFNDRLYELNHIISNKEKLALATQEYYKESMSSVEYFLNPYQNRIIRGLVKFGLMPSLFKEKWLLKLQNYICCEAHRDKVEYYLKNKKRLK